MAGTSRISITDLADGAAQVSLLDEAGQVIDPLVAVGLDGGVRQAVLARAAARARDCGRLLVGIASGPLPIQVRPLLAALDLTFAVAGDARECVTVPDPDQEAQVLSQAAARNPQAALVLGRVLRITEALPVSAALEVESFAYSTLLGGPEFHRWLGARGDRPPPHRRRCR